MRNLTTTELESVYGGNKGKKADSKKSRTKSKKSRSFSKKSRTRSYHK